MEPTLKEQLRSMCATCERLTSLPTITLDDYVEYLEQSDRLLRCLGEHVGEIPSAA